VEAFSVHKLLHQMIRPRVGAAALGRVGGACGPVVEHDDP
jgi:hypothetical protein